MAYDLTGNICVTASALVVPGGSALNAGTSLTRALALHFGKTVISGGVTYGVNKVGEHYGWSDDARFWAGVGAGVVTGIVTQKIDVAYNLSGYFSNVNVTKKVPRERGWKVGDPIDNLTAEGNEPKWSTVKQRYWKNEAHNNPGKWSPEDLELMRKGMAPLDPDFGVPMELHHIKGRNIPNPHNIKNLQRVWPWEHAEIDLQRFYTGPRP